MSRVRITLNILAVVIFTLTVSSLASAQATRTWVSGVGDDANPCSRTAPCKTFAGAISKTAAGGEISVLDPGGFGAINITKSITINGTEGAGYGSILASLTNGVIVNSATAIVRLRNLDINGAGTGIDGIKIFAASKVYIENVVIDGFTNRGINDIRTTAGGQLFIRDTIVRNTTQTGIVAIPGAGGGITAMLDNVRVGGGVSNAGMFFDAGAKATVRNSYVSGFSFGGIFASGTGTEVMIDGCVISHNGTGIGVTAPAVVRLNNTTINNNTTSMTGQAQVSSTGTNTITGNPTNNLPTGTPISLN